MNERKEFLKELNNSLQGEVSKSVQEDTVRYYSDYIEKEVKKGKPESEILSMLGNGQMIAKSIIEVHQDDIYEDSTGSYYEDSDVGSEKGFHTEFNGDKVKYKYGKFTLNSWYGKLMLALVFILLVAALIFTLKVMASIVWAILPVVLLIVLILYVVRFFKK